MEESERRPTVWIVVAGVSVIAAIGLLIWALSLRSDVDDANARADRAELAAAAEDDQLTDQELADGPASQFPGRSASQTGTIAV